MKRWFGFLVFASVVFTTTGCGTQSQNQLKIINGAEVAKDEHQSVVLLYVPIDDKTGAACTGTFIDATTVLTAAHCTGPEAVVDELGTVPANLMIVRVTGTADDGSRLTEKIADSTAVYRHPQWGEAGPAVNEFDVALVRFAEGISAGTTPLASSSPEPGDNVTVVGYGVSSAPVFGRADYSTLGIKRSGSNQVEFLEPGFIRIVGTTRTGSADGSRASSALGDSGGPMLHEGRLAGVCSGGRRQSLFRSVSLYTDLNSESSRAFLGSHGFSW